MHKVVVSFAPLTSAMTPGEEYIRGVADAFRAVREQRIKTYRTYRTYLQGKKERFTFATTSIDLHLELSMVSAAGQYYWAKLLNQEFREKNCKELLFSIEGREGAVLVTMTRSQDTVIFTLFPA